MYVSARPCTLVRAPHTAPPHTGGGRVPRSRAREVATVSGCHAHPHAHRRRSCALDLGRFGRWEERPDVSERLLDVADEGRGVCLVARHLAAHVEEQVLLPHHVAHAVPVIGDRAKATTGCSEINSLPLGPALRALLRRDLRRGQRPGEGQGVLEEGEAVLGNFQTTAHDVKSKQVTVTAAPTHGVPALARMPVCGGVQFLHTLFVGSLGIEHGIDEGAALLAQGPDRLSPPLKEQPGHGALVGQAEVAGVATVGELQSHLDEGVRRHAALLHLGGSKLSGICLPELEHDGLQVCNARQHTVERRLNGGRGGRVQLPLQPHSTGGRAWTDIALELFPQQPSLLVVQVLRDLACVGPFPAVRHDGGVGPRMLAVHARNPVGEHHQVEGLVAPPVDTIAAEEILCLL
mmetsp:Transcript_35190/g.80283  ORF Transcript_35190/g.80283 Transcript_35190/m.80283 type:complete len:405 (-) Transcript_35190:1418-2632(-)